MEKLFAAHQAFQQDRARGKTRHYYDLYELIGLEEVKQFIGSSDLWNTFEDVRSYCEEAFRSTSILSREELTQCSSFFPTGDDFAGLQSNYEESRSLYFVDPPKFADILNRIQDVLTGL